MFNKVIHLVDRKIIAASLKQTSFTAKCKWLLSKHRKTLLRRGFILEAIESPCAPLKIDS